MGGIENARFLLASRTQVDAGVANSSGLVGRAFMEHPHIYNAVYLLTDGRLDLRFYAQTLRKLDGTDGTGETSGPEARGRGAFALSQTLTTREELPAVACRLREADLDTVEEDATTGDIAPSEIAALLRSAPTELDLYSLEIRSEQRPLAKSRVSLSDERDAFGMPRTKLSWQVDPDDLRRIGRALEILGAELARVGAGRLWLPQDDSGAFDPPRILGGCHHMGTTPMGDDAATSVVDQNCRTHDVDNLYLAGSSVFPSTGFANPTLTIVALAHRLAEHLRSEA
jgi:choline dehydrogenase-like flavoprotein